MAIDRRVLAACILFGICSFAYSVEVGDPAKTAQEHPKNPFSDNVKVTFTSTDMIVESDGIPNHPTGKFPNKDNPNQILKQNYHFKIPLKPQIADKPTKTPFGPIGVAINGIPFYNQYNAEGKDAVKLEVFDSCCGHPDQMGRYHYHKYPTCLKSPFKDEPGKHSPLIGYAFDGFPIYGPNGEDGKPPTDLDECNGHSDKERGYHYHVTAKFPYIVGAYKGVVDESNFPRPGPGGRRGPPRNGQGNGPPEDDPRRGPPPDGPPPDGRGPPPDGQRRGPPPDGRRRGPPPDDQRKGPPPDGQAP